MGARGSGGGSEVRSVGRALDLLDIMREAAPVGIRVGDAAVALGVDPATASRLLATLLARGYASRLPNRSYTLGVRSLRLATAWVDQLTQRAGPVMAQVAERCGETVYLLQLVGSEAVTVARLFGNRRATIDVEVGPTYPLWASAAGRALLGCLPPVARVELLPAEPFPALTPHTKTTWRELAAALREAAESGIYAEEGEIDPHLGCYAMPLLHRSRSEKLAIAVSFETARPPSDRRFIREAMRRESRALAWAI